MSTHSSPVSPRLAPNIKYDGYSPNKSVYTCHVNQSKFVFHLLPVEGKSFKITEPDCIVVQLAPFRVEHIEIKAKCFISLALLGSEKVVQNTTEAVRVNCRNYIQLGNQVPNAKLTIEERMGTILSDLNDSEVKQMKESFISAIKNKSDEQFINGIKGVVSTAFCLPDEKRKGISGNAAFTYLGIHHKI